MFLKPGQLSSASFGISFVADKDADEVPVQPSWKTSSASIRDQRRSLSVAKYRCVLCTVMTDA